MPSGSLPFFPFAAYRELIERAAPLYREASLAQTDSNAVLRWRDLQQLAQFL